MSASTYVCSVCVLTSSSGIMVFRTADPSPPSGPDPLIHRLRKPPHAPLPGLHTLLPRHPIPMPHHVRLRQ
eukprot:4442-Eustigmatos_ZCMA.PRE.1